MRRAWRKARVCGSESWFTTCMTLALLVFKASSGSWKLVPTPSRSLFIMNHSNARVVKPSPISHCSEPVTTNPLRQRAGTRWEPSAIPWAPAHRYLGCSTASAARNMEESNSTTQSPFPGHHV